MFISLLKTLKFATATLFGEIENKITEKANEADNITLFGDFIARTGNLDPMSMIVPILIDLIYFPHTQIFVKSFVVYLLITAWHLIKLIEPSLLKTGINWNKWANFESNI